MKKRKGTSKKKIVSIDSLADEFKEVAELKRYSAAQHETISQLIKEIEQKNNEISHLKKMISQTVPIIGGAMPISNEEIICEIQIEKLLEKSNQSNRELTLDEIKKLDLLIKNKRLSREDAPILIDHKKLPANTTEQDLIKLVESKNDKRKK